MLPFNHLGDTMSWIHKLLVGLGGPKPLKPHSLSLFCCACGNGFGCFRAEGSQRACGFRVQGSIPTGFEVFKYTAVEA